MTCPYKNKTHEIKIMKIFDIRSRWGWWFIFILGSIVTVAGVFLNFKDACDSWCQSFGEQGLYKTVGFPFSVKLFSNDVIEQSRLFNSAYSSFYWNQILTSINFWLDFIFWILVIFVILFFIYFFRNKTNQIPLKQN